MKMACGKRGALQRVGWHGKGESGRYGCLCVCVCVCLIWYGAERRVCVSVGIVFESGSLRGGGVVVRVGGAAMSKKIKEDD